MIYEIQMVCTDMLMEEDNIYRKIKKVFDTNVLSKYIKEKNTNGGIISYGDKRMIYIFIYQFLNGLSYMDMEKRLKENIPLKWFCNFSVAEITPTCGSLCKFLKDNIGDENVDFFFLEIKNQFISSSLDDNLKKSFNIDNLEKIFFKKLKIEV